MFERFTEKAREVVVLAQEEARHFEHNYIGTEHLLLGLLREEEGIAARALTSLGDSVEGVREEIEAIVGYGVKGGGGQAPFTPRSKKVMELALREALQLGHNYIGTEHILLGILRVDEGVATRTLLKLDVNPDRVRDEVMRLVRQMDRDVPHGALEGDPDQDSRGHVPSSPETTTTREDRDTSQGHPRKARR